MDESSLIYPMFVKEGTESERGDSDDAGPVPLHGGSCCRSSWMRLLDAGVTSVMLFGIPDHKDEVRKRRVGRGRNHSEGTSGNRRGNMQISFMCITDVCMCEYTSHGHCGMLCGCVGRQRQEPGAIFRRTALSHIQAGADMVAPSDMMDGRVACDPYDAGCKRL